MFGLVIPTHDAEKHVKRLLESIRGQSQRSYRIAIVDQGSMDRTAEIAHAYGCQVINMPRPAFYSPPARSRNVGARAIDCQILLHLDADMELGSPDFLDKLEAIIDSGHQAVIVEEQDVASGFWARCKALERTCYRGTKMESARVVTRELFESVGGYNEEISAGEDFFVTRLYERRTHIVRTDSPFLRHHIGRTSLRSLLAKKVAYGRTAAGYLRQARAVGGESASSIVRLSMRAYLGNWRQLLSHPLEYLAIFPLRALELVAVGLGMRASHRTVAVTDESVGDQRS